MTNCFYDKTPSTQYNQLKKHRKTLLSDTSSIDVTDFGAGSRVFKSNKRQVSAIAKTAGITSKRQHLLLRLTRYFSSSEILELGTSLGMATIAMSLGNPSATITTVEGCPNTAAKAKGLFQKFQLKNISLHIEKFEDFLTSGSLPKLDLVYVDGNHDKQRTLFYFDTLLKHTHNNSVFIFDDIYWSPQMTEAWQEIADRPEVSVSIDTFQWGLVFFRKEQQKQHFTIRL